jgi:hypothetical protein
MSTVTIEYYGVTGQGATVTKAKQDAGARIAAMMVDGFNPCIVSHPYYALFAFVWRDGPSGWAYKVIDPADPAELANYARSIYGNGPFADKDAAIRAARRHMAQDCLKPALPDQTGLEFLIDRGDRRDHIAYIAWQRAFAAFARAGLPDTECHRKACELGQDALRAYVQDLAA